VAAGVVSAERKVPVSVVSPILQWAVPCVHLQQWLSLIVVELSARHLVLRAPLVFGSGMMVPMVVGKRKWCCDGAIARVVGGGDQVFCNSESRLHA